MKISIIAALASNNVIGKNNDLPWKLPIDMKHFMNTTKGHCVIMGRKNYDSIPKKYMPLPERTNIVLTSQKDFSAPGYIIVHSFNDAILKAKELNETELFIIGGSDIYKQALDIADNLYLTEIHANIEGDVYFPDLTNIKSKYKEVTRTIYPPDKKHQYMFDIVKYELIEYN
jgi:dihydrofolate reductase